MSSPSIRATYRPRARATPAFNAATSPLTLAPDYDQARIDLRKLDDEAGSAVGRSVIDDNELQIVERLLEDAADGGIDVRP